MGPVSFHFDHKVNRYFDTNIFFFIIRTNLGFCYANGLGVKQNPVKAVYWYRKASQQNHARAQDKLAIHLQNGTGVGQNLELAFTFFERAAEQNHVAAQYHLANCFEKGLGCPVDLGKATIWFERAAMGNR